MPKTWKDILRPQWGDFVDKISDKDFTDAFMEWREHFDNKDHIPNWWDELYEDLGDEIYNVPDSKLIDLVLLDWQRRVVVEKIKVFPKRAKELQKRLATIDEQMELWTEDKEGNHAAIA